MLKNGFHDIHFTHGAYEFGKDFIAKKIEGEKTVQYVFQSKGGNIGLADWGQIRWQIEEARINPLSHPSFDEELEREIILITTGRLVGGATVSAQQYNDRCKSEGKIGFKVWDIDTLIEMMLTGGISPLGLIEETPDLLQLLSKLKKNESNFKELEQYSRRWIDKCLSKDKRSFLGVILESTLFTHELINTNRLAMATYVSLFPVRAMVHALHDIGSLPKWSEDCLRLAEDHFMVNALKFIEPIRQSYREDESVFYQHTRGVLSFIAYPVICSQLMEVLGLLGLLQIKRQEVSVAEETADILETLINNNSGFFSPISDKYAVSIVSSSLLLKAFNRIDAYTLLIRKVSVWICNRYELSEAGLASPYSNEEEEIKTLLGYAHDFIDLPRRRESYVATIVIDLSALYELKQLYEDVVNDIQAVAAYPCNVEVNNTLGQYVIDGDAIYASVVRFKDKLTIGENWRVGNRQEESNESFCYENSLWWELISTSSVVRDRHFINDLRKIIKNELA
ncbi:hypothetical protein FHS14_001365 [Paenibacillus baekrokdamisoli]|uniref:hypothetical protein n=1 Tax=Paenibacillus baekrokdamisoli TaxID=1712516 RepID=UPI000F7ACB5D|nr:hypothetical protein [Paenibacillus baekrokdamisoli]MBB3068389.1 hypothetical protein [Paenibacillus baekrokdamisoli]